MTCTSTVDDYCARHPCARTLSSARLDTHLRAAFLTHCGDYDVVSQIFGDQLEVYYYKDEQLVAAELDDDGPQRWGCVAGPTKFDAPACVRSDDRLQPAER